MSVAPNLCCDETKNRGIYTLMTELREDLGAFFYNQTWGTWKGFCLWEDMTESCLVSAAARSLIGTWGIYLTAS